MSTALLLASSSCLLFAALLLLNCQQLVIVEAVDDNQFVNFSNLQQICGQIPCSDDLPAYCLDCDFEAVAAKCRYGQQTTVKCQPVAHCLQQTDEGSSSNYTLGVKFERQFQCRYCHQLEPRQVRCLGRSACYRQDVARSFYETWCEPLPDVLCLPSKRSGRLFRRMLPCNWSKGTSLPITLLLSVLFGGFGIDRFYLGLWRSGLGKLFSFGGLGIWSIVDFFLILSGYLKPVDNAVYW